MHSSICFSILRGCLVVALLLQGIIVSQRTFQRTCDCEYMVDGKCAYTLLLPTGSNETGCSAPTTSPITSAILDNITSRVDHLYQVSLDNSNFLNRLYTILLDVQSHDNVTSSTIAALNGLVQSANQDISSIRNEVNSLKDRFSTLLSNLSNFRNEIENLNLVDVIKRQNETIYEQMNRITTISGALTMLKQNTCLQKSRLFSGPNQISTGTINVSSVYTETHEFEDYQTQIRIDFQSTSEPGAWCPVSSVTQPNNEWIQFSLSRLMSVLGIMTKGRISFDQWIASYQVNYTLPNVTAVTDETMWITFKNEIDEIQTFVGNNDRDTLKVNYLWRPIWTQFVRIWHLTGTPGTPPGNTCARADIFGCLDPPESL